MAVPYHAFCYLGTKTTEQKSPTSKIGSMQASFIARNGTGNPKQLDPLK